MRRIDEIGAKNYKSFRERFVLVSDIKIKSWKFFFVIAFFVGMISATIWGFTTGKFNESSAGWLSDRWDDVKPSNVVRNVTNDPTSVINPATVVTGVPTPEEFSPSEEDLKDTINPATVVTGVPTPGELSPSEEDIKDAAVAGAVAVSAMDPVISSVVAGTAAMGSPAATNELVSNSSSGSDTSSSSSSVAPASSSNTPATSSNNTPAASGASAVPVSSLPSAENKSTNGSVSLPQQAQNNTSASANTATTSNAATATAAAKKSSKKEEPKEGLKIENSKNIVQRGETLVQRGDNFSKNSKVNLYFQLANGKYSAPQAVKTNSEGKFEVTYNVTKPNGTYKWYAYDVYSKKKSKVISYTVR